MKIKTLWVSFFFCAIVSIGVSGCSTIKSTSTKLQQSRNRCLKNDQDRLFRTYKAYGYAYDRNNTSQRIDSIANILSNKAERDTLFVIEYCNWPLYDYRAYIWNRKSGYSVFDSGGISNTINEDSRLIKLIETWNKSNILSKSHSKPKAYEGEKQRLIMCSRLVMYKGKCIEVETLSLQEIDMDYPKSPVILE